MAYNEALAQRVRAALAHIRRVEEKRMFGGLMFMVNGRMCISAGKDRLMCRIDPAVHDRVVKRTGCRPVVMNGRTYRGYVHVSADSVRSARAFTYWVALALDYNEGGGVVRARKPRTAKRIKLRRAAAHSGERAEL